MIGRWVKVLGSPRTAFAGHDPRVWGWIAPLALLAVLCLLVGAGQLLNGSAELALEQARAQFDAQGTPPEARETSEKFVRGFAYAGPVLGAGFAVVWSLAVAGALALLGLVLQPHGQPVAFKRALSMSSHASLATCLGVAALGVGALSGNPAPSASLAHVATAGSALSALGSRIDPSLILYYVVLASGIQVSLGFGRGVALLVSGGLYLGGTLLVVLGALANGAMRVQGS